MASASLTTIDNILKEVWTSQRVEEQLYQDNPILQRVKKLKNVTTGQQAQTTIHTGRNQGFSATTAQATSLNAAGSQGYAQATWNYKHFHQQVKIDGAAIDQSQGDVNALASVIDEEVSGAINDLNRHLSRMLQTGSSAVIATCGTTTSSADVVLATADFNNAIERGWLDVGTPVDIGTSADSDSLVDGEAILGYSTSAKTITVTSSISTTSSNFVVFHDSKGGGGTSNEMNGLPDIVGTASFAGVDPATYSSWKSPSVDSTSQALSLSLLYQQNQAVAQKTGKVPTYVVTGLKQQRKAYELAQAQVRFAGDTGLGVGSVDAVNINGVNLYGVPDVKNENIWFLTPEDIFTISNGEPYWQDKITGGKRLEWSQGTDQYVGKLTVRLNLGCRRRNSHAALTGLT